MRRVVSQGWLHASWRPRFTAFHLSWTTHPRLQRQAAVKVHGVFPSNHGYSASSPRLQFHRIPRRDSSQIVTPFVQVGTYPTRNFALTLLRRLAPTGWSFLPTSACRHAARTISSSSVWKTPGV